MVFRFRGGAQVPHEKHLTAGRPIEDLPRPGRLVLHLRQHLGAPAQAEVQKGDQVRRGQLVARAPAFVSAPVHAPTSGTVKEIGEQPHPVLGHGPAIVLEPDGEDTWVEGLPEDRDWTSLTVDQLRRAVQEAGVVGLGGATFPTHVKLTPPPDCTIDTVLLNGAECEPYVTSDDAAMRERPGDVVLGMLMIMRMVGAPTGIIGIEDNKPEAIEALDRLLPQGEHCRLVALPSRYPQGAERSLIKAILDRWVPGGKLPMSVGVVVQNVSTAIAIVDAVVRGLPLTHRVVTVTGPAVHTPRHVRAPLGASWRDLLEFCGGVPDDLARLVMGGPMMGIAQNSLELGVVKGTSALLALRRLDMPAGEEGPCIRCGRCLEVCPMELGPQEHPTMARERDWQRALEARVLHCVECGSCEYVCPARRPLVHTTRLLKELIREQEARARRSGVAAASAEVQE